MSTQRFRDFNIKKWSIVCFCLFLMGCQNPFNKQLKIEKTIATAQDKIDKNQDNINQSSKGYVFGADYSLSLDPEPSPYSAIAKDLTSRSLLLTGQPDLQTALFYQTLIKDLLSTNENIRAEAQIKLNKKDRENSLLQSENVSLKNKLTKIENEKDELARQFAKDAQLKFRIKQVFWWAIWIVGIMMLMHIISIVLPPPYNSIFSIVAGLLGLIIKSILSFAPKAANFAGVVGKQAYEVSEKTLKDVVLSIQEIKKSDPELFLKIEPILKDNTDREVSRPKIQEIKQKLTTI